MCGIAGYISRDLPPRGNVDSGMRAAIRYRGKDAEGEWSDDNARLFHSRLSIIAIQDGAQPMTDVDGRFVIVFNGEIYNYVELKSEYARKGARFVTSSDTEVILEGFKLKGPAVCQDLNGMFAFAIWDRKERKLFLVRDRLGKKPLFWTIAGDRFYFASTIDAFKVIPGWQGRLSPAALALYLRLGAFPNELTVFDQVRAVAPGTHAVVTPENVVPRTERYWRLRFPQRRRRAFDEAADEYEAILTDAIRVRLRSDVPLAITFSGGVDSGTIAALSLKKLGTKLACYTIDYDSKEDPSPETEVAKAAAAHLGLDWTYLHYDYRQVLFDDAIYACQAFDQPCNHLSMAYSQRLYDSIRPFATVVLSGGGADELFTGYNGDHHIYGRDRFSRFSRFLPQRLRDLLPSPLQNVVSRYVPSPQDLARQQSEYLTAGIAEYLENDFVLGQIDAIAADILEAGVQTSLDLSQYMSLHFFGSSANFLLPDVTGLRAQVEVRSPFLDYRMVEFAAALPGHFKVRDARDPASVKFLPKTVYERYVPRDIAWASKKGMAVNVRYGAAFANDPTFTARAEAMLSAIGGAGLDAKEFRSRWAAYLADMRRGRIPSPLAGPAMAGLMLGMWLERKPMALNAAA